MMKFPIGIQNFAKIRTQGYVYIDKTSYIYNLVNSGCYYFLSRPRRFGKSLLISTIESYFKGEKELFEGLDIYELEKEWIEYPIFHIDFNAQEYSQEEDLKNIIEENLSNWESQYGSNPKEIGYARRFGGVIRRASEQTGRNVVVLIDEYDKPIFEAFLKKELLERYTSILKSLYSVFKSFDKYIRFVMLSGVTKYGKINLFSDLNNFEDLSTLKDYSTLCGITEAELSKNFDNEISALGIAQSMNKEETYAKLRYEYGGYYFHGEGEMVYNLYSVISALKNKEFKNYWSATGSPELLAQMLQNTEKDLSSLTADEVSVGSIDCIFNTENPLPFIYQAGYLTISHYDKVLSSYKLTYPNRDVKEGFLKFLLPYYLEKKFSDTSFIYTLIKNLKNGEPDEFLTNIQSCMSSITYRLHDRKLGEKFFHNQFFIIVSLLGFHVHAEMETSCGRIDLMIETDRYFYIFEFKYDKSAEEAINQIEDRDYERPFAVKGKKIFKIGVNFSSKTRTIGEWIVK